MPISYLTLSMIVKTFFRKSAVVDASGDGRHRRVGLFSAVTAGPDHVATSTKCLALRGTTTATG